MQRTLSQNKRLHALLAKLGVDEETKSIMVENFTDGRTSSTAEMTMTECAQLINKLEQALYQRQKIDKRVTANQRQKARRNIFKLMYDIGLIDSYMSSSEKLKVINRWLVKKTQFEGNLNDLTVTELDIVIKQLQAVRRRYTKTTKKTTPQL